MYLDSAILVKLLVEEQDSDFYIEAVRGHVVASSQLAATEVWAALLRKERDGNLRADQRADAWAVFNRRVAEKQITLYPLNTAGFDRAHRVLERCHPAVALRSLDAIHCAACDLSQDFPLCSTDNRMRDAAVVLGIPVLPKTL